MQERILGIMSGSSLDGVDLALCHFKGDGNFIMEKVETIPLPIELEKSFRDPLSLGVKEFLHFSSFF